MNAGEKNVSRGMLPMLLSVILTLAAIVTAFISTAVPADAAATYDFLWPVKDGKVSGYYSGSHDGIDIISSGDDTIYAARAGKVIWAPNNCWHQDDYYLTECTHYSTYGNAIAIQHSDGTVAYYGHLKQNSFKVSLYQNVEAGQAIATMGSSGKSSGKHLHFEVRLSNNTRINVNPVSKGGSANYRYSGYNGAPEIMFSNIANGTYYLNNDGHRLKMNRDSAGSGSVGVFNESVTDNFRFNVVKEGSYYKISPISTSNGYVLNCYWGSGGTYTKSGNEVTLWRNDGDRSQRWVFEECNGGYLIHPADSFNLSITREGNKVYVKTTTNEANQIWMLDTEVGCSHDYEVKNDANAHWDECSKCGDRVNKQSHIWGFVYSNMGDVMATERIHFLGCKNCNKASSEAHVYSDSCDTLCDICESPKSQREPSHSYSIKYNAVGHWQECINCGGFGDVNDHEYTTEIIDGCRYYHCNGCDHSFKESINGSESGSNPSGTEPNESDTEGDCRHSYGEWTVVNGATCTESGTKQRTCNHCGGVEAQPIIASGHSFGDWSKFVVVDDTVIERRDCTGCEKYETREVKDSSGSDVGSVWNDIVEIFGGPMNTILVAVGGIALISIAIAVIKIKKRR